MTLSRSESLFAVALSSSGSAIGSLVGSLQTATGHAVSLALRTRPRIAWTVFVSGATRRIDPSTGNHRQKCNPIFFEYNHIKRETNTDWDNAVRLNCSAEDRQKSSRLGSRGLGGSLLYRYFIIPCSIRCARRFKDQIAGVSHPETRLYISDVSAVVSLFKAAAVFEITRSAGYWGSDCGRADAIRKRNP